MSVLFGVAGNSDTFTKTVSKASADAPAWLHVIGLDAYEYQCGKGVRVGEATARQIGENAAQAGITLSLHAPTSSAWPTPTRRRCRSPSATSPPPAVPPSGWGQGGSSSTPARS